MTKIISIIAVYFLVTLIIGWAVYNLIKHFKKNNKIGSPDESECQGCCSNCNISCKNNTPDKQHMR